MHNDCAFNVSIVERSVCHTGCIINLRSEERGQRGDTIREIPTGRPKNI
jgi:hypothetical protein